MPGAALRTGDDHLVGEIETITLTAEMDGWPWLARFGRCLQTACSWTAGGRDEISGGVGGGTDGRVEAAADLLLSLRHGDPGRLAVAAVGVALTAPAGRCGALAAAARAETARLTTELGAPALAGVIDRLSGVGAPGDGRPPGPSGGPAALQVTGSGPGPTSMTDP